MPSVARRQQKRHGKCRLALVIRENIYMLRAIKPGSEPLEEWEKRARISWGSERICRTWRLSKQVGEGAKPVTYYVRKSRDYGQLFCSCGDHCYRGVQCKHVGALVACGLISDRRPRPSEIAARRVKGGAL